MVPRDDGTRSFRKPNPDNFSIHCRMLIYCRGIGIEMFPAGSGMHSSTRTPMGIERAVGGRQCVGGGGREFDQRCGVTHKSSKY